jgi:hypothetical protein
MKLAIVILVSDCLISKKSSLKPLGQMYRNLVGSILGRSSLNLPNFYTFGQAVSEKIF